MSQKKDSNQREFIGNIPSLNGPNYEIIGLIFDYPNKTFHIRQIAKETKLSTTTVTRTIKELSKFNIITIEETDLTTNIKANLESNNYTFYKRVINLYRIERYSILNALIEAYNPEAIVLFGSFARGEDIEESDIDILVITNTEKNKDVGDFLGNYEQLGLFNRKFNLQILPSLKNSSKEFKNAVANGIVLHGYLKVV
jgi:predicted nucleotidyltransferase/predicted transcriptional regulator